MIHLNTSKKTFGSLIPFNEKAKATSLFSSDLNYLRNNAVTIVRGDHNGNNELSDLSKSEVLLEYANALITSTGRQFTTLELQNEIIICVIDVAFFYQSAALEMLQRAYDLSANNDNSWMSSGIYLKRGLGLLEFLKVLVPNFMNEGLYKRLSEMIAEFNLLQQLSILVLSLSKLKRNLSNDISKELDLQTNDLKTASSTSSFYAKIAVGCHETCIQLGKGHLINKTLSHYLEGLTYLLLSMDQYRNDKCGTAIGMLEQCINSFSHIIPRSTLTSTILSTPKQKVKPLNKVTNSFKSTLLKTKQTSARKLKIQNENIDLLPVLNDTLENFIVPLIYLLDYVYNHSNDKLFFQAIVRDEQELKKLVPRGKCPKLEPLPWCFNNGKLEEYRDESKTESENIF